MKTLSINTTAVRLGAEYFASPSAYCWGDTHGWITYRKLLLSVVTYAKSSKPTDPNTVRSMKALETAFDRPYLDFDNYVARTAAEITSYMHEYTVHRSEYNSPYTLVPSSMMGKTRHLKEVAARMPTVFAHRNTLVFLIHPPQSISGSTNAQSLRFQTTK